MKVNVRHTNPEDNLWPQVAGLFLRAVGWMNDPNDHDDYEFFAATDEHGVFLGASVIAIGPFKFGPLAGIPHGFLEDIQVLERYRRKGVGATLLRAALNHAWERDCHCVSWTVAYDNPAAIALYQSMGAAFTADTYPDNDPPDFQYNVVAVNPKRINAGYVYQ